MSFQRSPKKTYELDPGELDLAEEQGRRIRWERHPEDSTLLVVLDALTGAVIAVVRSLFEITVPRP